MKQGILHPYNRKLAYQYAKRWAYSRNNKYYNFDYIGGDCTNFTSQVLYSGGCKMNYSKWTGWYYNSVNDRAPAWTGVDYLYDFLINNKSRGPVGKDVTLEELEIGDIVQLNFEDDDKFNHSLIVTNIVEPVNEDNIFISTHTYDRFDYPLSNYIYKDIRYIHILGYRV